MLFGIKNKKKMLNLKNRFLSFTNSKTQEKHQVIGVQQLFAAPLIIKDDKGKFLRKEKSKEIIGFIIHTTYKVNHETNKSQTILSPKHFRSLTLEERGFTKATCLVKGLPSKTEIKLID